MDVFDLAGKSIFESSSQKKKKKYILLLFTLNHENEDKIRMLEKTITKTLKNYILVRLDEPDEGLKAIIVKNIEIVVIDSSLFNSDTISVDYAVECKKRKKCPILFVANNPEKLIREYREKLFMFEEFDAYFNDPVDLSEFSRKLTQIGSSKGRIAKRFSLNIPIDLYRLNKNTKYNVLLRDISLVGFGIIIHHEDIFLQNEQIQIKIPLALFRIFHPLYGEFLPLSGRLKRVSISGENMGFSLEFTTPLQLEVLTKILAVIYHRSKLTKFSDKPKDTAPPAPKKMTSADL